MINNFNQFMVDFSAKYQTSSLATLHQLSINEVKSSFAAYNITDFLSSSSSKLNLSSPEGKISSLSDYIKFGSRITLSDHHQCNLSLEMEEKLRVISLNLNEFEIRRVLSILRFEVYPKLITCNQAPILIVFLVAMRKDKQPQLKVQHLFLFPHPPCTNQQLKNQHSTGFLIILQL